MRENLQAVVDDIARIATREGRDPASIRLIAVSKKHSLDEIRTALACGQYAFGENQVQEELDKIVQLPHPQAEWHLIGHLQSNKVRLIPGNFQWLHTLDSLSLAQKLNTALLAATSHTVLNCLIQVNVTAEAAKSGIAVEAVLPLIKQIMAADLSALKLRGLMTIGVDGDMPRTRAAFARLRLLHSEVNEMLALNEFDQLSMGMSADYAIAIAEGATLLRIGSRIFGARS